MNFNYTIFLQSHNLKRIQQVFCILVIIALTNLPRESIKGNLRWKQVIHFTRLFDCRVKPGFWETFLPDSVVLFCRLHKNIFLSNLIKHCICLSFGQTKQNKSTKLIVFAPLRLQFPISPFPGALLLQHRATDTYALAPGFLESVG